MWNDICRNFEYAAFEKKFNLTKFLNKFFEDFKHL